MRWPVNSTLWVGRSNVSYRLAFRSYEWYVVNLKYCVLHRHQTTLKRSELCSTRTLNEVFDRVTSNDSSSSEISRLQTSSVCPSSAADQHFCRRRRHPSSSSAPDPSKRLWCVNVLFDNWSVSAAVAVETVVRLSCCRYWDRRPSNPTFVEDTIHRGRRRFAHPLRGRWTSSSSSSSSSSTSERRHPVVRRPRRPDTTTSSFVVACVHIHSTLRVRTLVVSGRSSVNCEF